MRARKTKSRKEALKSRCNYPGAQTHFFLQKLDLVYKLDQLNLE